MARDDWSLGRVPAALLAAVLAALLWLCAHFERTTR
jgi:hypothetical protein